MKKIKLFFLFGSLLLITGISSSYGFSIHNPSTNPEKYEAVNYLRISDLVNLTPKQFSELTGKKMNLWDRISFSIMKIKMKHDFTKNSNLTLKDYYGSESKKRLGIGWWILIGVVGLLLLLFIGFMVALSSGGY